MPAPQKKELSGWKAIADYLEVSIRTAQQREKELGLPVHHEAGLRGRVFADPDELDAWRQRARANGFPPQNGDPPDQATPLTPSRRPWLRASWIATVPAVALLAGGAYVLTPRGPLSDFRVEGKNLIAMNAKGQDLWRYTFGVPFGEGAYSGDGKLHRTWIGDIAGDGRPALLFSVWPANQDDVGSHVLCFAADGGIKWRFKPGRPVTEGSGERLLPPYTTNNLQVFVGRTPAETRIAVSSLHWLREPAQIALLDTNGRVVGEYWHPGHLNHSAKADLDKDGRDELLLAGVNNGNHQATLVVLDPMQIRGLMTTKEMLDHHFELLDMPAAKEKAVVFFPRSCISRGQPYNRVHLLRITADRVIVVTAEGVNIDSHGFVYQLDYGMHVQSVEPDSVEVVRAHQALEARGEVDHPFSEECARLKASVVVRRGQL
jgi:hypothetical protein